MSMSDRQRAILMLEAAGLEFSIQRHDAGGCYCGDRMHATYVVVVGDRESVALGFSEDGELEGMSRWLEL